MKRLYSIFILVLFSATIFAQSPELINYQAVVRDNNGIPVENTEVKIQFTVLQSATDGTLVYSEEQTTTTNEFGLVSLKIGEGTASEEAFENIDWGEGSYFLNVKVDLGNGYTDMGTQQLLSVPYALYAKDISPQGNFLVRSDESAGIDDVIFSVLNSNGDTVFAVYQEGVRIYVTEEDSKVVGSRGGFVVGGLNTGKEIGNEYFRVTPDSVRVYIKQNTNKKAVGSRGGFVVGGLNTGKGEVDYLFNIEQTTTPEVINPSEARIVWYPPKEAFMSGRVLVESPDSVGQNSWATGFESKSIGDYSQALGYKAVAKGNNSTAIGNYADAIGNNSYAFGNYATVQDSGSYAIGSGAEALGKFSFALGSVGVDSAGNATSPTQANGDYAYAFGMGSVASNQGDFAFGTQDTASGMYSLAMGYKTIASGFVSMSMGLKTIAEGQFSTAIGYHSTAKGHVSTAIGRNAVTTGLSSIAIGTDVIASGTYSTALGTQTFAKGYFSTTMGHSDTASGWCSTAIGEYTSARGSRAIAMGYYSTASGDYSQAMGYSTIASGLFSTAMGYSTTASGDYSTTMGIYAEASGDLSIAMGFRTKASGNNSTVMGYSTTASGDYSTAMGYSTTAQSYASVVLGQYNIISGSKTTWEDADPLFVIGNGTGTGTTPRSNALTVLKNGNVGIGTSSPDELLTVLGNARITGSIYYNVSGSLTYNKPDFVFKKDYDKYFDILSIEKFIQKNKHLPWITAAENEKNGVNMTRMSFETLEAVENQQLQIIELKKEKDKEIKELKEENIAQQEIIKKQQKLMSELLKRIEKLEKKVNN